MHEASREYLPTRCWRRSPGATNSCRKDLCSVVMEALHETAEPVAAKGVRDVHVFNSVAASACPAIVARERAHTDSDKASVLE
jgi:hypothetical protein